MTSSSSGHSSDDRWYELLEPAEPDMVRESPPPPLPARLGSGGNSAFQQVPPKQSHGAKMPVQTSHSLPLSPVSNYSLPPSSSSRYNTVADFESATHHDFKLGDKVTCLKPAAGDLRPLPRPALDYLASRTPKVKLKC